MRLLLLVSALILSVAVAAFLAISQNGGDHAAYAQQKATYSGAGSKNASPGDGCLSPAPIDSYPTHELYSR